MDSHGSRATLTVGGRAYDIHRVDAVPGSDRLPYSLRILLENVLRNEDGRSVLPEHAEAIASWDPQADAGAGDRLHPGARAAAGLHGDPRGRRPRRDA
jgi:aconitate hydratase